MKEKLGTIPVEAKTIYSDHSGVPFVYGNKSEVQAAIREGYIAKQALLYRDGKDSRFKLQRSFQKISDEHGRSMTEASTSKKVVWGGKFKGDIYGARSIKGTAFYQGLHIGTNPNVPYRYDARGLMNDPCIERVIKASKYLRQNGLPTERPVSVKELKWVVSHNIRVINIRKWKNEVLNDNSAYSSGKLGQMERYLNETKYIALERDVQIDERLSDLDHVRSSDLISFMRPVFKWLKVATTVRKGGLISESPKPKVYKQNLGSIIDYFTGYIPESMGIYIARMHNLGLIHGFPHWQNWSIVGTLYDLDSVSGKVLFPTDKEPSVKDRIGDISESLVSIRKTLGALYDLTKYSLDCDFQEDFLKVGGQTFLKSYLKERFGEDWKRRIPILKSLTLVFASSEIRPFLKCIWQGLS